MRALTTRIAAVDAALNRAPSLARVLILAFTIGLMAWTSLPKVPRQWLDFDRLPLLASIEQQPEYGTDTLSDMYGARVILNDVSDMYTKARTEQTPQEAATWSREASAPYPPAVLLMEAGLYRLGERTGIGFYGFILLAAVVFIAGSLLYFWRTRWYLFPLLYLNFGYLSERFVHVQDDTYLLMLVVLLAALWLARAGRAAAAHLMMAVAITMKLSGLYYVKNILRMPRATAVAFVAILLAGLVLPYFIWENYLYIYRYGTELKGHWYDGVLAALVAIPFALTLWYLETRASFDLEDLVGWGLVPFAMLLALKMNVPRHLLLVLLVPDKRGVRNAAAAIAMLVPAVVPGAAFGAATPIAILVLVLGLTARLGELGWETVRGDLRHPAATIRAMLAGR
jgi:hypothetical protein